MRVGQVIGLHMEGMPHPLINKVALSYSNTHVATSEFGKTKGF